MTSPFISDLNDFISPSQACIKPVPPKNDNQNTEVSVSLDLDPKSPASQDPVTISLNDCLACSGCITSAESVLVSQQTYLQLCKVLETNREAEMSGLSRPQMIIVSVSPQSRTAIAARYGLTSQETMLRISQFLKDSGVSYVFDTTLARDISLYECCREFLDSYQNTSDGLPLICGACPGWICYVEKTQPQLIDHLSRVKSPQQIMGTLVKYFFASRLLGLSDLGPNHIYHATVMPCFDKKLEASRSDFYDENFGSKDVDCVISTSELIQMLEEKLGKGVFETMPLRNDAAISPELSLLGPNGELLSHFGSGSGGYLENILGFASKSIFNIDLFFGTDGLLTLSPLHAQSHQLRIETQRNSDHQDFVLSEIASGRVLLRFGKVYGFRNVQTLVRKMKSSRIKYDYVEVMACPGACLNGGGQPRPSTLSITSPAQNLVLMNDIYRALPAIHPLSSSKSETVFREWLGGHSSPLLRTAFRALEKSNSGATTFSVQW